MEHKDIRESYPWTTYGKSGHEEPRVVILKDIHDDHLENLIPFLHRNVGKFGIHTIRLMLNEQEYRKINKIKVPFKFG